MYQNYVSHYYVRNVLCITYTVFGLFWSFKCNGSRGNCTPHQNQACFMRYHQHLKNDSSILKQISADQVVFEINQNLRHIFDQQLKNRMAYWNFQVSQTICSKVIILFFKKSFVNFRSHTNMLNFGVWKCGYHRNNKLKRDNSCVFHS